MGEASCQPSINCRLTAIVIDSSLLGQDVSSILDETSQTMRRRPVVFTPSVGGITGGCGDWLQWD